MGQDLRRTDEGARQRGPRRGTGGDERFAVDVRNISKTYIPSPPMMRVLLRSAIKEPVHALKGVSFQVEPGTICAIVGPNGAGKSTLFRTLTGLTTPTTGDGFVHGYDVTTQSFQVRKVIGFHAADERMLLGRHSVKENLMFHGRLQGIPSKALPRRIRGVLELVNLERAAGRLALALSSGMKARLQLARALLHRPRVLILDEPTGALDPVAAYQFLEIIKQATVEQGMATLISSHRLEEIEALPEHVLLLNEGEIVYDGHLDNLRGLWEQPRLEAKFNTPEAAAAAVDLLGSIDGVEVVRSEDETVVLSSTLGVGDLFAAANGRLDEIAGITVSRMPLRDLLAKMLIPDEQRR